MLPVNNTIVRMYLPQTEYLSNDIEKLYTLFEKRSKKKNDDNHVVGKRNPVQMILNVNHEMYDMQDTAIVITNSFNCLSDGTGFSVGILDPMDLKEKVLTVLKIGKAYIENCNKSETNLQGLKKVFVQMYLPQTMHLKEDNERLYNLFRNRAIEKSNDDHIEGMRDPVQIILNINGLNYDYQAAPLVVYKSFKQITDNKKQEIGFTIRVRSNLSHKIFVLTVLKKGKAFLENEEELEAYLKEKYKNKNK